jgi:hypothetical protein
VAGAHKIVWALNHHRHLTPIWPPQTNRRMPVLRLQFAHVLLITGIDLEKPSNLPRELKKSQALRMTAFFFYQVFTRNLSVDTALIWSDPSTPAHL